MFIGLTFYPSWWLFLFLLNWVRNGRTTSVIALWKIIQMFSYLVTFHQNILVAITEAHIEKFEQYLNYIDQLIIIWYLSRMRACPTAIMHLNVCMIQVCCFMHVRCTSPYNRSIIERILNFYSRFKRLTRPVEHNCTISVRNPSAVVN